MSELYFYKIINDETKQVDIGDGSNYEYYKSQGMVQGHVELGADDNWYVQGYAPKGAPKSVIAKRLNNLQESYLKHLSTAYVFYNGQKYSVHATAQANFQKVLGALKDLGFESKSYMSQDGVVNTFTLAQTQELGRVIYTYLEPLEFKYLTYEAQINAGGEPIIIWE